MVAPHRHSAPGKLRIVGGDLRGSKLAVADLDGLRPTPDRVRETLFNWLAPYIGGAHCLDLFAGTGALGIEALSRGAARVDFVERDARLAQALRDNLARLRQENGHVRNADALALLGEAARRPCDIVFLDPPFASNLWDEAARLVEMNEWLSPHALIYVESAAERTLSLPSTWQSHRAGRAGATRYALYRRSDKLAGS
ncbi:MAG: 16S rRNA (guanine(966)-N(2))-methyltransferase RsmD [Rudaea sp.]|uniref:16S rRNA (guanine(966)-N(2))-methyltransferase RsmD n=1 Tax=Rudaea sp. TaxID=2136325 RepID=UPI0039E571CE